LLSLLLGVVAAEGLGRGAVIVGRVEPLDQRYRQIEDLPAGACTADDHPVPAVPGVGIARDRGRGIVDRGLERAKLEAYLAAEVGGVDT
jgi:hypothetical protein